MKKKSEKIYLGPTEIIVSFESDLDHHLNTKKNPDFPTYLLSHAFAEVCTLRGLMFRFIITFTNNIGPTLGKA